MMIPEPAPAGTKLIPTMPGSTSEQLKQRALPSTAMMHGIEGKPEQASHEQTMNKL
jgi:hypothetical protein